MYCKGFVTIGSVRDKHVLLLASSAMGLSVLVDIP